MRQIVALRGDAPNGAAKFVPHEDGFAHSVELVAALARTGKFEIAVGAYPEPHPDAADPTADVRWLKRKVDAGAAKAITQFFFDPDVFFRFRDDCVAGGIHVPIIPGILPIQGWAGTKRFAARCGGKVPKHAAPSTVAVSAAAVPSRARLVGEGILAGPPRQLHCLPLLSTIA